MKTKTFVLQYLLIAILSVCGSAINANGVITLPSTRSTTTPITVANPKTTTSQNTKSTITPVIAVAPVPYSRELYCCYSWGAQICSLGYGDTNRLGASCTCGNVHGTVC